MTRVWTNAIRALARLAAGATLLALAEPAAAAGRLSIAYMPHPVQEEQLWS